MISVTDVSLGGWPEGMAHAIEGGPEIFCHACGLRCTSYLILWTEQTGGFFGTFEGVHWRGHRACWEKAALALSYALAALSECGEPDEEIEAEIKRMERTT